MSTPVFMKTLEPTREKHEHGILHQPSCLFAFLELLVAEKEKTW